VANPLAPADPQPADSLPGEISDQIYQKRYAKNLTEEKEDDNGARCRTSIRFDKHSIAKSLHKLEQTTLSPKDVCLREQVLSVTCYVLRYIKKVSICVIGEICG
jgi:hypothetical protein